MTAVKGYMYVLHQQWTCNAALHASSSHDEDKEKRHNLNTGEVDGGLSWMRQVVGANMQLFITCRVLGLYLNNSCTPLVHQHPNQFDCC